MYTLSLRTCRSLGWNEDTWGRHTAKTVLRWGALTEEDQEAAGILGYDQTSWDHYADTQDDDAVWSDNNDSLACAKYDDDCCDDSISHTQLDEDIESQEWHDLNEAELEAAR